MLSVFVFQTSYVYVWLNAYIISWAREQAKQILQEQQVAPNSTTYNNVVLGLDIVESMYVAASNIPIVI